ncbi:MAG: hypothetical protein AAFZ87_06520, partial [Planctomycetota bacterium]
MQDSPLLRSHEAAGARLSDAAAHLGRVLTYGSVPEEVEAGMNGVLVLDRTTRGLVSVSGTEAEDFLHRILANRIKGLEPGTGNRNLLLTGKGKVVQVFDLAFLGEGYLLSAETGQGEALRAALDMYLFAEDVAVTDETESYAPLELVGPKSLKVLGDVLEGAPEVRGEAHAHTLASFGGSAVRVVPVDVAGAEGWRVEAEPARVPALFEALLAAGARAGGLVAYDSLRADRVAGAFGQEITDDVYPQEARLEDAFSLEKGCYIGQEVVAKIDTYGGLNKRLHRLRVSSDDPVPPGTRLVREVRGEERDLGVVTS